MPRTKLSARPRTCERGAGSFSRLLVFLGGMLTLLLPVTAVGDEVYRWTAPDGTVHYSTTPPESGAAPAKLPTVRHEDLDKKIERIRSSTPPNCESHGGVDCAAGADADGSVICRDGYREAILPFRFSCMEVSLESTLHLVLEPKEQYGEPELVRHSATAAFAIEDRKIRELRVNVRNKASAQALQIQVSVKVPAKIPFEKQLAGPEEIEPFGLADYTIAIGELGGGLTPHQINNLRYRVRCINCRGTALRR